MMRSVYVSRRVDIVMQQNTTQLERGGRGGGEREHCTTARSPRLH
jgi:hypothetical protein